MKLRPEDRISIEEAERRALEILMTGAVTPSAIVADHIWPNHKMKAQGAGASAARVLVGLKKRGLVEWASNASGWGWRRSRGE